jgi:hypothetical protein
VTVLNCLDVGVLFEILYSNDGPHGSGQCARTMHCRKNNDSTMGLSGYVVALEGCFVGFPNKVLVRI